MRHIALAFFFVLPALAAEVERSHHLRNAFESFLQRLFDIFASWRLRHRLLRIFRLLHNDLQLLHFDETLPASRLISVFLADGSPLCLVDRADQFAVRAITLYGAQYHSPETVVLLHLETVDQRLRSTE